MVSQAWAIEAWHEESEPAEGGSWKPYAEPDASPGDGLLGIYALRALERGAEPRRLVDGARPSRPPMIGRDLPPPIEREPLKTRAVGRNSARHAGGRSSRPGHSPAPGRLPLSVRFRRLFGPLPLVRSRRDRRLVPA